MLSRPRPGRLRRAQPREQAEQADLAGRDGSRGGEHALGWGGDLDLVVFAELVRGEDVVEGHARAGQARRDDREVESHEQQRDADDSHEGRDLASADPQEAQGADEREDAHQDQREGEID